MTARYLTTDERRAICDSLRATNAKTYEEHAACIRAIRLVPEHDVARRQLQRHADALANRMRMLSNLVAEFGDVGVTTIGLHR